MIPTIFEVRVAFLVLDLVSIGNLAEAVIDDLPWWRIVFSLFGFALWMSLLFGSLKCEIREKGDQ